MLTMSRRNTPQPIYITVEPTTKQDKLLLGRLSNYFVLLSLLCLDKYYHVDVPETVYWIFASAAAGLELGQFINLIRRK